MYSVPFSLLQPTSISSLGSAVTGGHCLLGGPTFITFIMHKPRRHNGKFIEEFAELLSLICAHYSFSVAIGNLDSDPTMQPIVYTQHDEATFSCYAAPKWSKLSTEGNSAQRVKLPCLVLLASTELAAMLLA